MFNKEMFLDKIKKVDKGNYDAKMLEFDAIHEKNNGAVFESMSDAFNYGFLKGQQAQKKRTN